MSTRLFDKDLDRTARWVAFLLLAACALALGWQVSVPYDIWWQLANGRQIWQTRQLVRADPFTFTIHGQPYLDKYWAFETIAFLAHKAGGWNGLAALHILLLAGVAVSVWSSVRRSPFWAFLALAVPALLLLELRSSLRTYLLSFILLPAYCRTAAALTDDRRPASWKTLGALALLQAAWVNLHSEFLWGVLIAALFAAEAAARAGLGQSRSLRGLLLPSAAVICVSTACLVNPFGVGMLSGVAAEAQTVGLRPTSAEWLPFARYAQPLAWTAWAALVVLVGLSFRCARRFSPARLALFGFFAALSLRSFRFLGPMALTGVFVGMENFSDWTAPADRERHWNILASGLASVLLLALFRAICTDRLYHAQRELKRFGLGFITSELPVDCSRFIRENGLQGHFLNDWSYGGYLVWHNGPEVLVAEDGRTAPFPRSLSDQIRAAFQGDAAALERLDSIYALDGAVVPWEAPPLLNLLARQPDWACLFVGMHSSVWMKHSSLRAQEKAGLALARDQMGALVLRDEQAVFEDEPWLTFATALYRRGSFLCAIGELDLAREQALAMEEHAADHVLLTRLRQRITAYSGPP
ncbi:MAG: hypothetical protein JXB04_09925 [Kiritimatiellae bacterium]|nr:hypothetical protein [Kiritimatiellia bacterium]